MKSDVAANQTLIHNKDKPGNCSANVPVVSLDGVVEYFPVAVAGWRRRDFHETEQLANKHLKEEPDEQNSIQTP